MNFVLYVFASALGSYLAIGLPCVCGLVLAIIKKKRLERKVKSNIENFMKGVNK